MKKVFHTLRLKRGARKDFFNPPDSPKNKVKTTDDLKKKKKSEKEEPSPSKQQLHSKSLLEPVIPRKWCNTMHCAPDYVPEFEFSLCTQNILADRYVNFNTYAYCNKKYMYQRYRHRKLLQAIEFYKFDIMCFQELQGNMLEYLLRQIGEEYEYRFKRVTKYDAWNNSKDEDVDPKTVKKIEGVGIFWKKSKFKLVEEPLQLETNKIAHQDVSKNVRSNSKRKRILAAVCQHSHNVALGCILEDLKTEKKVCVSTIHGYFRKDRFIGQTYQCDNFFNGVAEYIKDKDVDGVIICGDFNIYNTSRALRFIEKGKLSMKYEEDEINETNVYKILKRKPCHPLGLRRSYPSKFKPFSHYSARKKQLDVLDYIFHQPAKIQPVQVLRVSKKEIKGKFPSKYQNSDHLMLGARFKVLSEEEIKKREKMERKKAAKKVKLSNSLKMDLDEEEGEGNFNF